MIRTTRVSLGFIVVALLTVAVAVSGCGVSDEGRRLQAKAGAATDALPTESAKGSVSLRLLSSADSGVVYRLRDGEVTVQGPTTLTFDTETNPELTALSAEVAIGAYTATLTAGWRLESVVGEVVTTVTATLLSPNPVSFSVVENGSTSIPLRFRVGDTVVGEAGAFQIIGRSRCAAASRAAEAIARLRARRRREHRRRGVTAGVGASPAHGGVRAPVWAGVRSA